MSAITKTAKLGGGQRKSNSRRRRAMLEYIRHGKRCKVKFLDADVKRSFVSAVMDEGIVVVFGLRVSSLEKREAQRIPMHARRRVFSYYNKTRKRIRTQWKLRIMTSTP